MDKGFQLTKTRLDAAASMSDSLKTLGRVLLLEIGGSMGPLYGQFFKAMAKESSGADEITSGIFLSMLEAAICCNIRLWAMQNQAKKLWWILLIPPYPHSGQPFRAGRIFQKLLMPMIVAAEAGVAVD